MPQTSQTDSHGTVVGGLALASGIALAGWRAGALTRGGALVATGVGAAVFGAGGRRYVAPMIGFFGLSSALSHVGKERKRALASVAAKGERRDAGQVLANGGVPAMLALASMTGRDAFPGYLGALAAVNADTWSTELGGLSRCWPRSIASGRPVPPGTSGGVTALGLAGALAGGAAIGALARPVPAWLLLGTLAGLAGSLVDSLLGATVQRVAWCPACGKETERAVHTCGTPTEYRRGYRWLDNDRVNLLASLTGALAGVALSRAGRAPHRAPVAGRGRSAYPPECSGAPPRRAAAEPSLPARPGRRPPAPR